MHKAQHTAIHGIWGRWVRPPAYVNEQGLPTAHGRVRTLADMTQDEITALERRYGCPVRPGTPQ